MRRTAHPAPARSRMYPPEDRERESHGDWEGLLPTRAVREDQKTRAAWTGGQFLRSPYLTMIDIPARVGAGDRETATGIYGRVVRALAIKGRWTGAERRRLRALRDRWETRAQGEDVYFNLCGWEARGGTGDVRAREFVNEISQIREVMGQ